MAKPMIIRCTTHPYHVTSRTYDQTFFPFPLKEVWEMMITQLFKLQRNEGLAVHAFVLMGNHFHLLCQTPRGNLDEIMRAFLHATSIRLNQGWEPRYRWSLIESQTHYFQVYRYIYQNPIRAGLCLRVEDYLYTTLKENHLPLFSNVPMSFGGSEGEIEWLNEIYGDDDQDLIKRGLKKSQFNITQRKLKAFNKLSVPLSLK
jgi:putative transposase